MKSINPGRVKMYRSYSVCEVAQLFGLHKQTVRRWIKKGLPICDKRRPLLILGRDLRMYLEHQVKARKRPCGLAQLFCVRCRAPKKPDGGMVDYIPSTCHTGNLRGLCPDCGVLMHRAVRFVNIGRTTAGLDVAIPLAERRLSGTSLPAVSANLGVGGKFDATAQP